LRRTVHRRRESAAAFLGDAGGGDAVLAVAILGAGAGRADPAGAATSIETAADERRSVETPSLETSIVIRYIHAVRIPCPRSEISA
jgi:hypothetical protein